MYSSLQGPSYYRVSLQSFRTCYMRSKFERILVVPRSYNYRSTAGPPIAIATHVATADISVISEDALIVIIATFISGLTISRKCPKGAVITSGIIRRLLTLLEQV